LPFVIASVATFIKRMSARAAQPQAEASLILLDLHDFEAFLVAHMRHVDWRHRIICEELNCDTRWNAFQRASRK